MLLALATELVGLAVGSIGFINFITPLEDNRRNITMPKISLTHQKNNSVILSYESQNSIIFILDWKELNTCLIAEHQLSQVKTQFVCIELS